MNETLTTILVIFLALLVLFGLLCVAVYVVAMVYYRKFKKRINTITNAVNRAVIFDEPVRLDGVHINKEEAEEIKAFLRARKGQEAHDLDIIDRATEFRRDI